MTAQYEHLTIHAPNFMYIGEWGYVSTQCMHLIQIWGPPCCFAHLILCRICQSSYCQHHPRTHTCTTCGDAILELRCISELYMPLVGLKYLIWRFCWLVKTNKKHRATYISYSFYLTIVLCCRSKFFIPEHVSLHNSSKVPAYMLYTPSITHLKFHCHPQHPPPLPKPISWLITATFW